MKDRIDILVLGATGFTGKFVTKYLATIHQESEYCDITWGIAGRSTDKLQLLLDELTEYGLDTGKVPAVQCNVEDEASLKDATGKSKVLVNCTGPYEVLGRPIVTSCIQTRTQYVDISAELHHILDIYREYNKAAEEENVLVIPSCGIASIPAATGLMFLQKQFQGNLDSVECYIEMSIPRNTFYRPFYKNCLVHYGTWASLVHVLQNMPKYVELKKKMFPDTKTPESKTRKKSFIHRHNGSFWYPYPGPDDDVIDMSMRYLKDEKQKKRIFYKSYFTMPSVFHFIIIPLFFLLYYYLCRYLWFRNQLWKNPRAYTLGYMSHEGPSEKNRNGTKFSFSFTGKGWEPRVSDEQSPHNKTMTVTVSGTDPGYRTTAVMLVSSAITLLKEKSLMPKGGVVMPGAAFQETNIIEQLISHGINYEILVNN